MSLKAASAAAALLGTGGTVLCSARLDLPERLNFLSLDGLSANSRSTHRVMRSRILVNEDCFHAGAHLPHRLRLVFAIKAADSTQPSSVASAAKDIISDDEFSLAKVSFGVIGLSIGLSLLSYGFGAYFNILPGSEWSAIMLTYGFPLAIIGMALKYAELKPVECLTYSDAQKLREQCATPILKQVRNDVIRYRYGDEQHLDEALKRIFQYGQGGGIARRSAPILKKIREEVGSQNFLSR